MVPAAATVVAAALAFGKPVTDYVLNGRAR